MARYLNLLRYRASFDQFYQVIEQMTAIQYRYWQKIEDAKTQADRTQEEQEMGQAGRGGRIGELSDADRSGKILDGSAARQHSAEQAKRGAGQPPGLLYRRTEAFLAGHVQSIRTHIERLGNKNYPDVEELNALDFVLMFVPIEAALIGALQSDPTLPEYALKHRVALLSPLMMTS